MPEDFKNIEGQRYTLYGECDDEEHAIKCAERARVVKGLTVRRFKNVVYFLRKG